MRTLEISQRLFRVMRCLTKRNETVARRSSAPSQGKTADKARELFFHRDRERARFRLRSICAVAATSSVRTGASRLICSL